MTTTYEHARERNAGQVFTDREGNRALYSDRSDATRQAFGRLIWADGTLGNYGALPDNLYPERYNVTAAHDFAQRVAAMGFAVYLAQAGHYGFISDETGSRVLSFQFDGVEDSLSGNYGPPSQQSGTGWRMNATPQSLRTPEAVREALYSTAPDWTRRNGKGWKHYTTLESHLATYGKSSGYRLISAPKPIQYKRGCDDYAAIRYAAAHPEQIASEVSPDEYEEMLGCVPPIYREGVPGFLVGEALTSGAAGTVYANYFISRDGLHCARYHLEVTSD